jgi:membrane associated rhomboid family serine protease
MFFPYATDAPVYYWPFTTVAMIVVNVLVFALEVANDGVAESLVLVTGSGLHPLQWLTTNFAHASPMHLVGNMLFLWSFGLIVEGKLGWLKTLILYLGIGVVYGAIVQTVMLFASVGPVLGASAVVFGFMAMSLIWAPENSLKCVLLLIRVFRFELSVKLFVGIFLGLQVVGLFVTGMALSSEFLHAIGAGLGFAVGIWMVKTKRVDCENWDIFSIRAGRHRMSEKERNEEVLKSAEYRKWQEGRTNKRTAEALDWIREQVREGNVKAAMEVCRRTQKEIAGWSVPEADLVNLIVGLRKAGLYSDVIPLMVDYLTRYSTNATTMRIALGEALVREQRPAQAIRVLGKLADATLDAKQRQFVLGLREKARKLRESDPYEVADEDW